jgi:hypothetical protein
MPDEREGERICAREATCTRLWRRVARLQPRHDGLQGLASPLRNL